MTITTGIDKRTGRAYGDHGTALQAIQYVVAYQRFEADTFLKCWLEGDLDEWPEFYTWLAKHPEIIGTKAESAWQPIATAPKDGTHIILARFGEEYFEVAGGEWRLNPKAGEDGLNGFEAWISNPTHWMPIPTPPKQEKSHAD